ncbi:MAG: DUF2782 domain-containing protein [Proteobacteria bacterium]|nr:DUF2782 domain-containing protein [Pseudomonadota bacterium]
MARVPIQSPDSVRTSWRCARLICTLLITALLSTSVSAAQRGPDVVIIAEEDRMIYEFRQNGELRMIRVVPNAGKPYYLVPRDPTRGDGDLRRVDALVPSWVLWEFD